MEGVGGVSVRSRVHLQQEAQRLRARLQIHFFLVQECFMIRSAQSLHYYVLQLRHKYSLFSQFTIRSKNKRTINKQHI